MDLKTINRFYYGFGLAALLGTVAVIDSNRRLSNEHYSPAVYFESKRIADLEMPIGMGVVLGSGLSMIVMVCYGASVQRRKRQSVEEGEVKLF